MWALEVFLYPTWHQFQAGNSLFVGGESVVCSRRGWVFGIGRQFYLDDKEFDVTGGVMSCLGGSAADASCL
jgi:hypothetical protein